MGCSRDGVARRFGVRFFEQLSSRLRRLVEFGEKRIRMVATDAERDHRTILALLLRPSLEFLAGLEFVADDCIEKRPGFYGWKRSIDAQGGILHGHLDDVAGTVVELAAVAGLLFFLSPFRGGFP